MIESGQHTDPNRDPGAMDQRPRSINFTAPGNKTIRGEVLSPESQHKEWDMSGDQSRISRRNALKCMAYGGAGTLFVLSGGVFTPMDLALAADGRFGASQLGKPLFVQISDTHIGFNKDANPDVTAASPHHPHRRHHASVEGRRIRCSATDVLATADLRDAYRSG
jgi:hypothetical protein